MAFTPWQTEAGSEQERAIPTNFPADGTWSFVLGHDEVGRFVMLNVGDSASVYAYGDFESATIVRFHGRLRGPEEYPAGVALQASLLIDGVAYASRTLEAGETRDLFDMAANVVGVGPGNHELRFRFELVSA